MPFVYVSLDDYLYLKRYSELFNTSVKSVMHERISIFKSASSFAYQLALDMGAKRNARFEEVVVSDSKSGNLISLTN